MIYCFHYMKMNAMKIYIYLLNRVINQHPFHLDPNQLNLDHFHFHHLDLVCHPNI